MLFRSIPPGHRQEADDHHQRRQEAAHEHADGRLLQKRRKITPTYHERMVWGQGDGSGLAPVDTRVGRVGALACWEHYNPLARYALMAQHEQIHCAQFPGSLVGPIFAEQMGVTIRHHALESGCFVVNATGWLHDASAKVLRRPDVIEQLAKLGAEAVGNPQPEFAAFVQAETDRWGRIIRDKGIKPE